MKKGEGGRRKEEEERRKEKVTWKGAGRPRRFCAAVAMAIMVPNSSSETWSHHETLVVIMSVIIRMIRMIRVIFFIMSVIIIILSVIRAIFVNLSVTVSISSLGAPGSGVIYVFH